MTTSFWGLLGRFAINSKPQFPRVQQSDISQTDQGKLRRYQKSSVDVRPNLKGVMRNHDTY
jgi:hypothetical protein